MFALLFHKYHLAVGGQAQAQTRKHDCPSFAQVLLFKYVKLSSHEF